MHNVAQELGRYCIARLRSAQVQLPYINLEPLYRFFAKLLIRIVYRIEVSGFDNIPDVGPALLISNHVSYVDGLIINAVCKRKVRFVIDQYIYQQPVVNYFMRLDHAIPIAAKKESVSRALDEIAEGLSQGDLICIFPEGQITYTGYLSHFRPGTEWILKRTSVNVYPIVIHGLWGSIFSRKHRGYWWRFIPKDIRRKVTIICGEAIPAEEASIDHLQLAVLGLRNQITEKN